MAKSPTLTLVDRNPAENIRRIVNISRDPRMDEKRLLEESLNRGGSKSNPSNIQYKTWDGSFNHREQDLVAAIQNDSEQNPNTAYCIFSTDLYHSGTAVATQTCANFNVPLIIFQHKNGNQLDSVEVLFDNKRYVTSASQVGAEQTMSSGAGRQTL